MITAAPAKPSGSSRAVCVPLTVTTRTSADQPIGVLEVVAGSCDSGNRVVTATQASSVQNGCLSR